MFDIEGEGFIPVERFRTILKEVDEDFTEDELDDIIFEVGLIITIINIIITIINLTIITEDELGDIIRWVETVMWRPIRRRKYLEDKRNDSSFVQVDADGSGTIDFDEFVKIMT